MRQTITTIVLAVLCLSLVFAQGEYPILEKQVEIRQARLAWLTKVQEVSAQALIGYIDGISEGAGTAELNTILEEFQAQVGVVQTVTTHVALNNALRQLRQITTDFRQEYRKQFRAYGGKGIDALVAIKAASLEHADEIEALKDNYWQTRKINELANLDKRIERAQNILNKLDENGYDTTEAQAKLDEIAALGGDLEDVLDSRDNQEIMSVYREMLALSKELRQIVRDLQVKIPHGKRVEFWLKTGARMVERTGTIIDELETLGIDVAELREIHDRAQADLDEAQAAFDAGNLVGAVAALRELKTVMIELRDAYEELIFGGALPDNAEAKVTAAVNALDSTVGKMSKDV